MVRPPDTPQPISKAELLMLLDLLPEQIVVWDGYGRVLLCNAAFAIRLALRERGQALPHTPVVAITASALAEEIVRWLPAPAGQVLRQAGGA